MKKVCVLGPLAYGLFPIMSLFSHNAGQVSFAETWAPMVLVAGVTLVGVWVVGALLRDVRKGAVMMSVFWILFFSYGHICNLVSSFHGYRSPPGMGWWVLGALSAVLLVCFFLVLKMRKGLGESVLILNVMGVFLVGSVLVGLVRSCGSAGPIADSNAVREYITTESMPALEMTESEPAVPSETPTAVPKALPNIYYIILDGYARGDVLKELYGYDNSEFIDYLKSKGFYVAEKSRANYCQSVLSLASSLNVRYLDKLVERVGSRSRSRGPLTKAIRASKVVEFLKKYGYQTVSFDASGWAVVQMTTADRFYKTPGSPRTGFQNELLNTTPVPNLSKALKKERGYTARQYDFHRHKLLYAFDKVAEISAELGPVFVFAHFLVPHQPFVFDRDGDEVTPPGNRFTLWHTIEKGRDINEYKTGYREQLMYVNKRARTMIDTILSRSPTPPIIIVQSDHGPASQLYVENAAKTNVTERMSILNAYYLPGSDYAELYATITPVNTFRVILNRYFGGVFELLPDRSYYSAWCRLYNFVDVTDRCMGKSLD